jgi:membrane fusion protein (multidrug efflux system)
MPTVLRSASAIGLAFCSAAVLLSACGGDEAPSQPPALEVVVAAAELRDVPLSIEMVGTLRGTQDVPIRARVEGFLERMEFQEGTFVDKGDLLYTIDPQPFAAKLVEAQSQRAAATTQLAKAEADLSRIRPLAEMNAVSEQDLDSAVAQEAAARAGLQAADAAVELAEIELSYTRITAPIGGLIGLSQAKPGEFVGRDPNPIVLNTLSDIDPIRTRFSISEREYLVLARTYLRDGISQNRREGGDHSPRGDKLTLILADGTEHPFKGEVVAASQSIDPETGTYSVEAAFPNPDRILLPGQFARVRALYEVLEDSIVIPRQSVSEIQGLFRVYTVDSAGTVAAREVDLGPETGHDVVIESGLEAGVDVIVEGLQRVRPGMTVTTSRANAPGAGETTSGG